MVTGAFCHVYDNAEITYRKVFLSKFGFQVNYLYKTSDQSLTNLLTELYLFGRRVFLDGDVWKKNRGKMLMFAESLTFRRPGVYIDDAIYMLIKNQWDPSPFLNYHTLIGERRSSDKRHRSGVLKGFYSFESSENYSEQIANSSFKHSIIGFKRLDGLTYGHIRTLSKVEYGGKYSDQADLTNEDPFDVLDEELYVTVKIEKPDPT